MGKLLCDSTASVTSSPAVPWREQSPSPPESTTTSLDQLQETYSNLTSSTWESVKGLEDQQIRQLVKLHDKGILWIHPGNKNNSGSCKPRPGCAFPRSVVFRLTHGGEVSADGNCLFTASAKAIMGECVMDAKELRRRTVRRFVEDLGSANEMDRDSVNKAIRNMYCPDLKCGWGVQVVQEVKLLAKKQDRRNLDDAIDELGNLGMIREFAAESIYKERCIAVEDGSSWAKYMSISGSLDDEYDIITLQYTEEGLLSLDENREGHSAAFGDDIAIECLATEFKREIFVVQAHGSDAMVDEDNCVFFLPHRPRSEICELPIFLFMKGTGWCGAGADHYEPLIAHSSSVVSHEKVALVL